MDLHKEQKNKKSLNNIISVFIKKIYKIMEFNKNELDNQSENLSRINKKDLTKILNSDTKFMETINLIDKLIDALIDICIKNKIYYFIKNDISYTTINKSFKKHLTEYLHNLIYNDNTYIEEYFKEIKREDLDNYSDINSIFLHKFKNRENSKVSFNVNVTEITFTEENTNSETEYDDELSNKKNKIMNDNDQISDNYRLAMYIKIIFNESKNIVEFVEKLTIMCYILYDPDLEFNINYSQKVF